MLCNFGSQKCTFNANNEHGCLLSAPSSGHDCSAAIMHVECVEGGSIKSLLRCKILLLKY